MPTDWAAGVSQEEAATTPEMIQQRMLDSQYNAMVGAVGQDYVPTYAPDYQPWYRQGGIMRDQYLRADDYLGQRFKNLQAYEQQIAGQRTQAQKQLAQGIDQQRIGGYSQAAAMGSNPALGRAAVQAGGSLEQRGVTQAAMLQAQERAYLEELRAKALAAMQAQAGQQAGQELQYHGIASDQTQLAATLAQQQQAAQSAAQKQQVSAGLSAGGAAAAQLGDWLGMYDDDKDKDSPAASDIRLKTRITAPQTAQEDALIRALRAETGRTERQLDSIVRRPRYQAPADLGGMTAADRAYYQQLRQPSTPPDLGGLTPNEAQIVSDLRAKTGQTDALLDELVGSRATYEYRPEARRGLGQPGGRQYGPMAQDLERSPLARGAVVNTPKGKMIDAGRMTMVNSGLIGRQQELLDQQSKRLANLEEILGRATRADMGRGR